MGAQERVHLLRRVHVHAEPSAHHPECRIPHRDATTGPPRAARISEGDGARCASRGRHEQCAPVGIAADNTIEHDEVVHGLIVHLREIADHPPHAMRYTVFLGELARGTDGRGNRVHYGRLAHPAPEQLDRDATDPSAAFEYGCFMEVDKRTNSLDQPLRALGQAARSESSGFTAGKALAEYVIETRSNAVTCHNVCRLR